MNSTFPKILLISPRLPGSRDGGGVVLDEILKRYPKDRFVFFSTNPDDMDKGSYDLPTYLKNSPYFVAPLVPRLPIKGTRLYMPALRAIGFYLLAPIRIKQAFKLGKRYGAELVWGELYGDSTALATKVATKLGVPLIATVWDDPEGWLQDGNYDRFSRWFLWKRFRQALKNTKHLSTAGEAMQRVYRQKYGVNSVILRHGLETLTQPPDNYDKDQNEVIIGFIGSPYGKETWMAFLSAVSTLNKSGMLPRIKFRTFGGAKFPYSYDGVEIEDRGWQPQEMMMREIADTDFCYLPYWFESHKRRHVELSFPNKFETYVAAGKPVFFHGPPYAGIAETVTQYGVGLCVHTLDQDRIASALKHLILDPALRAKFSEAAISAFNEEFNVRAMIRNFAQMIGVDPSLLLSKQ